jgi:hypothetical protein
VVKDLTTPIRFRMTVKEALQAGEEYVCQYFNVAADAWATDGCTTDTSVGGVFDVDCLCTHLTTFSVAATPASSSSSSSSSGIGLIIGIVVGVIVLLGIVVFVIMNKNKKSANGNQVVNINSPELEAQPLKPQQ